MNKNIKNYFIIFFLLALVALTIKTFTFLWRKSQPKTIVYKLVEVKRGEIQKKIIVSGKIEALDEVTIKTQLSGIVVQICKNAGEFVKKGEVIAKIKPVSDMLSISKAQSEFNKAEINKDKAEKEFNRQNELFGKMAVSKKDYEESEFKLKTAIEDYKSAKNNIDLITSGITKSITKDSDTLIKATVDGMIISIPIKIGAPVTQISTTSEGSTIAIIADMKKMVFIGKIDETDICNIKEGMPLKLNIGAIKNSNFDAKIDYISPKGIEENGNMLFEIKATMIIPDEIFVRSGYSANAEIVVNDAKNIFVVSENTVEFENDTAYVYILKSESPQTFEKKQVSIGISDGLNIEIKSGVDEFMKIRGEEIKK